jgi:hypothetical protein
MFALETAEMRAASSPKRSLSACISALTSGRQLALLVGGLLKNRLSAKASATCPRHALTACGFSAIACRSWNTLGSTSNALLRVLNAGATR